MANQWNSTIATQTVAFRGTSSVEVRDISTAFPNLRVVSGAVYGLNVAGGVSGSFGVHVVGMVGGFTYTIAGLTAISAVGNYILYPTGYSSTGALQGVGTGLPLSDANRIDQTVPPVSVNFQSGVATAGISANCTVSASLYVNR